MSLLEVTDLNVWFDLPDHSRLHAVQGISFGVDRGHRLGLVGESGCGKSTALMALMGLLPSNATVSGRILLDGEDILAGGEDTIRPHRWLDVAMVFQGAMNAFNPVQTVGRQIMEPMELHGTATGAAARNRTEELLHLVGIAPAAAQRYPHEFSGGMRQRAALAMALACEPRVLLADEPTTALDVMVQAQILELLTSLTEELGLALVLVTHDLPVVAQSCEAAVVMYAGRLAERAPIDAMFHQPRHPYTELLFAATPDLYGDEAVVSIPGVPPRLDRPLHGCPFAPRCPKAFDRCTDETPLVLEVGADHTAACHLNDSRMRVIA
ncbi:MAG TPA: ABC transporter ATP-binding protein [Nocardioidaceae bacterium]|jgi:oligopeptide/dipeptide ABC transporter ATP-binding protein